MQEVGSCPEYPATNLTLLLDNTLSGDTILVALEESNGRISELIPLEGESHYSFHVVVTNAVGTVKTRPVNISRCK